MSKLGDWNPVKVGQQLADILRNMNVPPTEAPVVVMNMLVALLEGAPRNDASAVNWVERAAMAALESLAVSRIAEVISAVRADMSKIPGYPLKTTSGEVAGIGDYAELAEWRGVYWEILEVKRCNAHSSLEPVHDAFRVVAPGNAERWMCATEAINVETRASVDNI